MHKYDHDYSGDTAAGHLVDLLTQHVASGVVVDLGCGNAPIAEPLRDAGYDYVGFDIDPAAVASLVERGVDARLCDLTVDDVAELVDEALEGRSLAAITAIDVIEHLPGFEPILARLAHAVERHDAVLGVSIPNVTHEDLGTKLIAGRWDVTDTGLLDSTHVNLFDERRLDLAMAAAGLGEVARHDTVLERTEQGLLHRHPFVYAHTSVGEWLRHLRDLAGPHASTYQFVRLYRARSVGAEFDGAPPSAPLGVPSFTVVVMSNGDCSDDDVAHSIASIDAQLLAPSATIVAEGAPAEVLDGALSSATTTHLCFVEAGDSMPSDWLAGFAQVLEHHPERVARHPVEPTEDADWTTSGLLRSIAQRDEPVCAFAVPVAPTEWLSLAEDRGRDALWLWILRSAALVGLVDVDTPTKLSAVSARPSCDVLNALGADALLLPVGWQHEVAAMQIASAKRRDALADATARVDRLALEIEALRDVVDARTSEIQQLRESRWWRVTGPGRRTVDWLRGRRRS